MTSATSLDGRALAQRIDPQGLLERIEALPEQCREAWDLGMAAPLPPAAHVINVVICGMGGSAIGGDLVRALAAGVSHAPVTVVRGYELPAHTGAGTLALFCSASGNTEETLAAFDRALDTDAHKLVITKGGALLAEAQKYGVPAVQYRYDGEPRSGLGYGLMIPLAVLCRLGVLDELDGDVDEAIATLVEQRKIVGFDAPEERNPAKRLARSLHGRITVVIGGGILSEAAHRWATQFHENGKVWAFWQELPELNHNLVEGFGLPPAAVENVCAVFLRGPRLHPRVLLRYDVTRELMAGAGVALETVDARGESPLAQVLSAIHFGDYVSYYLALLNGVTPSPVPRIDVLKRRLREA